MLFSGRVGQAGSGSDASGRVWVTGVSGQVRGISKRMLSFPLISILGFSGRSRRVWVTGSVMPMSRRVNRWVTGSVGCSIGLMLG